MNPFFIHSDAQSRVAGGDVTTSSSTTSSFAAALPRASTAPATETRQRSSSQQSWESDYERDFGEPARVSAPPPGDDGIYSDDEREQGRGYWRRGERAPPAESVGDLADGEGLRSAAERYTFGDDASNAGDAPGGSATAWDADVAAGTMRPDGRPAPEDSDFGAGSGFTPDGRPDFDAELDYVDPTLEGYDDRLANFREACKASGIPAYAECGMLKGGDSDDPESFERHLPARFAVMQCVDLASAHGLTRSMFEEAMHDWPKHELAKAWATKAREVRLGGKQLTRRAPRTQERSEAPAPRGGHKNNRPRPADFYVQRTRANYDFPPYYPYKGKRGPPAPKPTADTYSRDAFRGWVAHKAATATGNGPVTFNDATAALMGNFQGTRKALVECLDHAVVRKIDAAADPFPRGREATLHVRFQRGLFLGGGIEIKDSKSLDQAEALFRRNKPLFRAAHRYFAGELSRAEEIKLEIAVKNMVAARHQGAAHSVEIKATDVAAAATSLSNASATLHVEHSVSMFPELVELARDAGLPEGRTRFLIRTMAGVAAVATAPTALAAGLALTQLVAGDPTLWALCEGAIGAATRVTDGASQQGPFDGVRDWALKSSALLTLREFFGEIWNSFVPGVTEILEGLKKGVLLESGRSFGRLAVDFFEEFAARVRRCIRERSFAPLWGETWDPDGWIADVRAMIRWFPLLTTPANSPADQKKQFELAHACGLPRYWNETISLGAYHASLQVLLVRGEQIYKGLISAKKHSAHLAKVLEELRAFLLEVETQIGGSCHRFVPFAIFFHGVAGGGKTEMAKELATVVGKDMGYDCGSLMTYQWDRTSNFQDTLTNVQWHYSLDDMDQNTAPASAGVKSHPEIVIDVVNSKPLPIEKAAVEMKGRIFGRPLFVTYCSNYEFGRLKGHIVSPAPFWRRFPFHVKVTAKEPFAMPDGSLNKVAAADSTTHDMWELEVRRYNPPAKIDNPHETLPYGPVEKMTFPEFARLVRSEYRKHAEQQRRNLARTIKVTEGCPVCGLSTDRTCGCSVQQGLPSCFPRIWRKAKDSVETARARVERALDGWAARGMMIAMGRTAAELYEKHSATLARAGSVLALIAIIRLMVRGARTLQARMLAPASLPESWRRAAEEYGPARPPNEVPGTFTYEEMARAVQASTCDLISPRGGHAAIVGHSVIMYPTHLCKMGERGILRIGGKQIEFVPNELNMRVLTNPEFCIVRVPSLPASRGVGHFFPMALDVAITTFDEVVMFREDVARAKFNGVARMSDGPVLRTDIDTRDGDCGFLLAGRVGNRWFLRAQHYLRWDSPMGHMAGAAIITQREIGAACERVGVVLQGIVLPASHLVRDGEGYFGPLPAKSEVGTAIARGAIARYVGELHPRPFGTTFTTNVKRTSMSKFFEDLERDWCGEVGYWRGPIFKGEMRGEHWWSPYQDCLLHGKPFTGFQAELVVAIMDYVAGMDLLDTAGYRFLTEAEAIAGIDGTWVNPINPRTSVGPPLNQKKYLHFSRDEEGVSMSPDMQRQLDELLAIMRGGDVPCAFARCVLKDEARKPGAAARVFNVLPATYNILLKMYFAPLMSFFRSHFSFFECAIGIDMSSDEVQRLVDHLLSVGDASWIFELDAAKLDKSFTPEVWDAIRMISALIAMCLGLDWRPVAALVVGLQHTHYELKGDVFEANCNPSGQNSTVEINSICVSTSTRYCYYRERPELVHEIITALAARFFRCFETGFFDFPHDSRLAFRRDCALATYGDDMLAAPVRGKFGFTESTWAQYLEVGIVMTDADKTGKPVGKHIENVSFLKRGLKYDRELRRYIAPISLKTIAKMLVVQVDSTLSESDHCSVAISNALREASLHPEPIFDQVMSRAVSAVADLGLSGNPNLDLTSYAVRRNQMREGTFSAWALPHRLQGLSTLSSAMNTVPIPSAPNSGAIASSDAGALSAPTSVTADPGAPVMPVVQLEENNLNDALTRFVQLGTYALSSTDATFSKTFEIRPLDLLLNNPLIVAKLNNFALMRADMEVVVMGTFPPGSYGLGEVSAYPTGGGAAYPGGDRANGLLSQRSLQPLKCREVDIHASMDYSSAESVSLVLPWFYPFDFAENPANKGAGAFGFTGMWDLVFTNLASVSTAVPGGVAHGQLTVFGRIRPGYVLSTPVMQGKRGHIAGAISKLSDAGAAAPKTGPVSSVAKVVSDVGSKLSALPFVGGVASAVSGVADVVGNIAAFFGYSKTAAEPALVTTQNTNWNNFATLDGTESAYNAQLIPGIQIGGGPELVGQDGEDVASFPSLFKRWVALASISWNTQSNDTRLYHCDVTPSLVSSLDGASLCTGGFIGLPFANWRGDMEYCVEVVCSPLHRGTIQAAWVPFGTAWSTGDPTNTALNHVWDIEPGKRKIIRVPYARAEPYMANLPYSMATAVIPSGAANGTFFLRVVNPLQTQVSGQSVTVLVWYRCAENMDFRVPRESINNLLLAVPAVSPMTDVRLQGLGDADVVDEEVVVFGSSGDYAPDMVNFPGTGVRSVRALMQKPSRLFLNSTFITAYNTFKGTLNARIPVLGFLPSSAVSSGSFDNMWTWVGHYRGMFAAVATSERIGILTTIGCTSGAARVTAVSGAGAYGAAGCVLMPFQLGDGGQSFTNVPWSSTHRFFNGASQDSPATPATAATIVSAAPITAAGAQVNDFAVYHSFCDDMRLGRFMQTPLVDWLNFTPLTAAPSTFWQRV